MPKSNRDQTGSGKAPIHMGLFRTTLGDVGDCARMHSDAGDAGPFLPRTIYKSLHFKPDYEDLPSEEEYQRGHPPAFGWSA